MNLKWGIYMNLPHRRHLHEAHGELLACLHYYALQLIKKFVNMIKNIQIKNCYYNVAFIKN